MSAFVSVTDEGGIAVVRIDRPPANAMDIALLEEAHGVLARVEELDPRAVVITGRPGFFSAGADLKAAPTLDAEGQRRMVAGINRMFLGWYSYERPVVSAVGGHAIAGGFILALCGDYRVGPTSGKFGLTELKAGIPYPAVAIETVRAELAPHAARRLVLRAGLVGPEEVLALGAFDELAEPDAVLPRALEVARELAELPAAAYATIKRQLRGETWERMHSMVDADPVASGWLGEEAGEASAGILRGSP